MVTKRGIAVMPGIVVRRAFVLDVGGYDIQRRMVSDEEAPREIERLNKAIAEARRELEELQNRLSKRLAEAQIGAILSTHLAILNDEQLTRQFIERIKDPRHASAEYAVFSVLRLVVKEFQSISDEYLAQRVTDIYDIEKRLLRILLEDKRQDLRHLTDEVVVVSRDLTPSQTASLDTTKVKGFATDAGGRTSHTAIVARALGIPAVVGLESVTADVAGGDTVIIDGNQGLVIISPDDATLRIYTQKEKETLATEVRTRQEFKDMPAVTKDGVEVKIMANIDFPEEVGQCLALGAVGIGLYRTEFLFLGARSAPTEREHFDSYLRAVQELGNRHIIIRTLDLGADKAVVGDGDVREFNPFLGCRSIRFCFRHLDVFKTQLRAILRVSAFGRVRIMFPLISCLDELRRAKAFVHEVMDDLEREDIPFRKDIKIGIMIEVPSAAVTADILAKEADFFSIGTNDLVQYTLAVDRDNESVADLYRPADPSILRLIRNTVAAAEAAGIPVGMCGEMAGDAIYTMLLLGLGVKEFSVSPPSIIPELKKIIRSLTCSAARAVAEKALTLTDPEETAQFLRAKIKEIVPELS